MKVDCGTDNRPPSKWDVLCSWGKEWSPLEAPISGTGTLGPTLAFVETPHLLGRQLTGALLRVIGGSSEMGFGYLFNDDGLCVAFKTS